MTAKKKLGEGPATLAKISAIKLDIAPIEFTDATELRAVYDATDAEVKRAVETSVDGQADAIIALAKMRSLLSQRGGEKLRKEAGIKWGWLQYFAWFKKTYDLKMCLRTVVSKIDQLDGKKLCPECRKTGGHTPSCSKYKKPQKYLSSLEARLIGTAAAGNNLCKACEQGDNINEAIHEFRKRAPTQERLDEYCQRQSAPYEPQCGDLIVVGRQTYTLVDTPTEITNAENGVLTLTLKVTKESKAAQSERTATPLAKSA
jgi:hypothetical protein